MIPIIEQYVVNTRQGDSFKAKVGSINMSINRRASILESLAN